MKRKTLWLVYRRLRPSLGTALGFVLMYAMLTGNMYFSIVVIALGFMLIHLFGDCYDDCCNVEEDRRNKRNDKLLLNKVVTKKKLYTLSLIMLFCGLLLLFSVSTLLLLPGLWCAFLAFSYSSPKIRLKKYGLITYMLGGTVWIFTFLMLEFLFIGKITEIGILFIIFSFSQYVYILCQKDSTDRKDRANLFISGGPNKSFVITASFGAVSSLSLLLLSTINIIFIPLWALNFSSKFLNLIRIRRNTIKRSERGKFVLIEFLTPYLYIASVLI